MATNNSVNTPLSGTSGTGNFTGNNSPTLTTPKINQINDTSGNGALLFNVTGSAVNFFNMTNATTGNNCVFGTSGSDSNISMRIQPKGTGYVEVYTLATTGQIQWVSGNGSSYTHRSIHNLPTTAATTNYTWPDLSGTVALSGASQDVTFNSVSWSDTTKGIVGTTTNNNASAGYVGEFISSEILSSSYITLTIGAVTNVTSITLTAGDWDVWGNIALQFTNNNGDYAFGAINTTSATLVDPSLMSGYQYGAITTGYWRFTVPYKRISVSSNTTTYLVVQAGGTGTVYAGGAIYARRVR